MHVGDFAKLWENILPEVRTKVSILARVQLVKAYLADPTTYAKWRKEVGASWRKEMMLPSFDVTLELQNLGSLQVQLEPGLNAVERGKLLEGETILITEISKVNTGHNQAHLLLHQWKSSNSHVDCISSPTTPIVLSNYRSSSPLGHPESPWLCPWTLLNPLWPPVRISPQTTLPRNLDLNRLRPLAALDSAYLSSSSLPPLLVRLLAASRTRLKLQQGNPAKPWIALKNLLVADKTGHTVVTLWDSAVEETVGNWREGDILLLEGSYRVARHRDPIKDRLAPKLRHLAVSPTEVEVKVNSRDLTRLSLIASGATAPSLPPSLCSFRDIRELREGRLSQDRPVDIVGAVIHHGRWERQACNRRESYTDPDSPVFNTGQFWVRVWLELVDHSSSASIPVKLYLDREQWTMALAALPGTTVILTNLLYKLSIKSGGFSHLESSTETQVFCGAAAEDGRFSDEAVVASWREAAVEKEEEMRCRVEQEGTFGGHRLPEEMGRLNQVPLLETKEQLVDCLSNLAWKAGVRRRVRGVMAEQEEGEEGLIFCPGQPGWGSLPRKVEGLAAGSLQREVEAYCQMNPYSKPDDCNVEIPGGTMTVNIVMADCNLMVQLGEVEKEAIIVDGRVEVELCIDLFRLLPAVDGEEVGEGVEAVLRQVVQEVVQRKRKGEEEGVQFSSEQAKIRKADLCGSSEGDEDTGHRGSDEYDSDSSVHTQDLLNLLT